MSHNTKLFIILTVLQHSSLLTQNDTLLKKPSKQQPTEIKESYWMLKTCINQTVPGPGQKSMKFSVNIWRTKSVSMLSLRDGGCPVTLQDQQPHSLIFAWPAIAGMWMPLPSLCLPWGWCQSLSMSHQCCSHQHSGVAQPLLRRKNPLLTHILFQSRRLFLDATGLTHQPKFKSPTTGFSSFYFTASVLFLRSKRWSFWTHTEHIFSVFPFCAEIRLSRNLALCLSAFGV